MLKDALKMKFTITGGWLPIRCNDQLMAAVDVSWPLKK
jgi:hypothetical protein